MEAHRAASDMNLLLVDASDLQRARTVRSRLRDDARRHGGDVDVLVAAVTVHVLIDEDYGTAVRAYAQIRHAVDMKVLTYVGTASGLESLISDAYVAEAADAFILKPLQWSPTVDLVTHEVVPALRADGRSRSSSASSAPTAAYRAESPQRPSNTVSGPATFAVLTPDNTAATPVEDRDRAFVHGSQTVIGEPQPATA